jgi:PAS domain S-box-containing protein
MSIDVSGDKSERNLRLRALRHLMGPGGSRDSRLDASAALAVLHELASSPSTADAALTLLHELQVHQVELDLQDEELRRSRSELEAALARQMQLYDFAPVGYVTIDRATALRELNLAAAGMLGFERDQLLGRALDLFLEPSSSFALRGMLDRLSEGAPKEVRALRLAPAQGRTRDVLVSATRDPDGQHFLVTLANAADHDASTSDHPGP